MSGPCTVATQANSAAARRRTWAAAAALGIVLAWSCFARLVDPYVAHSGLRAVLLLAFVLAWTLAIRRLIVDFALPCWRASRPAARVATLAAALAVGAGVAMLVPVPLYPLAPVHQLTIVAPGERNPLAAGSEVWVLALLRHDGTRIDAARFVLEGAWEVRDGVPVSYRNQPARLRWRGPLEGPAELRLYSHPYSGFVEVTWDGHTQRLDLYSAKEERRDISLPAPSAADLPVPAMLAYTRDALSAAVLIVAIGAALLGTTTGRRLLPYSLACAIPWLASLAAFWPGLMNNDVVWQWTEMLRGPLYDTHPALHAMTFWLITRFAPSPAAVVLVQIAALSLLVGWALARLRSLGVPVWLTWTLAALFALSPFNLVSIVALRKDTPYGICVFALTLLMLEIVLSRGAWLRRPWAWVVLGGVAALCALYRHNGPPIAFATLVLVFLAAHLYRRRAAAALALAAALVLAVRGPLFRALDVRTARMMGYTVTAHWVLPLVHLVAAHVAHGTPLRPAEQQMLDRFRPPDAWPYDPYTVDTLVYDGRLNLDALQAERFQLARLAWRLTRRAPRVTWNHLCSNSSLVWQITQPTGCYIRSEYGLEDGRLQTIAPNELGLAPHPPWPEFSRLWADLLLRSEQPPLLWFLWRPAFLLYVGIAATAVLIWRTRRWLWLLVLAPALLNSFVIALVTPTHDFRYQYPVHLAGLLLFGLLFQPARRHRDA